MILKVIVYACSIDALLRQIGIHFRQLYF